MVVMRVLMGMATVLVSLSGCSDMHKNELDADADSVPLDGARPGDPDFYGEQCSTPSTPFVANVCRESDPYPKALCTPQGICRPWCNHVSTSDGNFADCKTVGGVEAWTVVPSKPSGDRGFCYCAPPQ